MNALRQEKMIADIIISGVPECENDNANLLPIVHTIMQKLSYEQPINIVSAHRIGRTMEVNGKKKERSILVQFSNKDEKYKVLACKKKQTITCDQIVINGRAAGTKEHKVFFDERITKATSDLFYAARKLKKRNLITHAWIRYGNLFVKKNNDADAIRIHDIQQLRAFEKRRKENSSVEFVSAAAGGNDATQVTKKQRGCDNQTSARITRRGAAAAAQKLG